MLTICPYLLKPIAELDEVSDEHIIPHAMGGSDQFTLPADKKTNSDFGKTVDSDLIHDPQLRFMAATAGVESRSGEVVIELPGEIVGTDMKVLVPFDKNGLGQARVVNGYLKDPISKKLTGLNGFDRQIESAIEQLGNGKKKWEISRRSEIDNPVVKVDLPTDLLKVSKGTAKIAYLMACRTFGDNFALSPDGGAFRAAIHAKDFNELEACGLMLLYAEELPLLLLPDLTANQHQVACFRFGQVVMATVRLFGGVATSTFAFGAGAYQLRPLDGVVVTNDIHDRTITERRLQQAVEIAEMTRRMSAYNARQRSLNRQP